MAKFSDFIAYFKAIASSHKSIGHTDQNKHFFRMELDEVLSGIKRSDVNYPLLILEGYSFDFADNKSDNILKYRSGAFILLDHISDISDFDLIHTKWDEMEEIATEILIKILNDKRNRLIPVVRDFDFSSVNASLLMNQLGNDVGIRITYTITSPVPSDIDTQKWR